MRLWSVISFIKSAKKGKDFPESEKEIVFVGRSNVGKSSLINSLYKKNLAYTGKTPGKTRMINFFNINDRYTAVDVPGYGYARRSQKEALEYASMMDDYFSRSDRIRLVVQITDVRIGLTQDDIDMEEYLIDRKLNYVIIANKIDKLSNNQLMNARHRLYSDRDNVIYVSAEKRKNIEELKDYIDRFLAD